MLWPPTMMALLGREAGEAAQCEPPDGCLGCQTRGLAPCDEATSGFRAMVGVLVSAGTVP